MTQEALRLRRLAEQCRAMAATLHARETAETLCDMARHFDASADAAERLVDAPTRAANKISA